MRTGTVLAAAVLTGVLVVPTNAGGLAYSSDQAYSDSTTTATGVDDFGVAGVVSLLHSKAPTVAEQLSGDAFVQGSALAGWSRDHGQVPRAGMTPQQIAGQGEDYSVWSLIREGPTGPNSGPSTKDLAMMKVGAAGTCCPPVPAPGASVLGVIGLGLVGALRRRFS